MTPAWIARHWRVPRGATRIMIPGYCEGDLSELAQAAGVPVERGPRDLRELPATLGQDSIGPTEYGAYDIEILAEINHAPQLSLDEILAEAKRLRDDGADIIDVGCDPGEPFSGVGEVVRVLLAEGHRVSIDSLNPQEISPAVQAGAELVLSVDATNRQAAVDWGVEVVAIPDKPGTLEGLDETVEFLAARGVRLRIDPVLEPIGFGFAASMGRYIEVRQKYPDAEMLMGIGNLTELTDADSAAINVLLLGFCQEIGVRSVLTTQVINWARTSVKECNLARRLVYHSHRARTLPKHVEPRLVTLRDPKLLQFDPGELERLAADIKDHNYRIFTHDNAIHLVSAGVHLSAADPFDLFEQLAARRPPNLDATHAFYLGFEMAKALTALTLGKNYRQDEALDWGFLTKTEKHHRLASSRRRLATDEQDST
jgi:dihydropteroate synthase-like protein